MAAETIFILGGARSGKSTFAEQLARERGGEHVVFIATAEALDDEMRARIERHRAGRPSAWRTLEAPRDWLGALACLPFQPDLILLDCLTLWVSNELLASQDPKAAPPPRLPLLRHRSALEDRLECELDMVMEWAQLYEVDLILISNEVGLGIVPENPLARRYRDVLGRINAHVARKADRVYWMVAGLPVEIQARSGRAPWARGTTDDQRGEG